MEDLQPRAILTDGDEAIRNVVERLMPAARHRLCAWHIRRNIGQNVKDHAAYKSLGKMINISMFVTEWEAEWHSLVGRHGLVDNVWVTEFFNRREGWAKAFFRGHFYGGMFSTQRVEGMHSKLKPDLDRYTLIYEMMPRMERSVSRIQDGYFTTTSDTMVFYIAQYDKPNRRWSVEFQSHETNPLISSPANSLSQMVSPAAISYV
ncbi:hypothetical protein ACLB2K_047776 [Fragaria x ananassa]